MHYQVIMVFSVESPNKGYTPVLSRQNLSLVTHTECSLKLNQSSFSNGAENISCLDNRKCSRYWGPLMN